MAGHTAHKSVGYFSEDTTQLNFRSFSLRFPTTPFAFPQKKFFNSFLAEKEIWWISEPYSTALRIQVYVFPSEQPINLQLIPEHDQLMATSLYCQT